MNDWSFGQLISNRLFSATGSTWVLCDGGGGGDPFRLPANRPPVKAGIENEFDPDGLNWAVDLPVWTFHGTMDGSVPIVETEILVRILKDAGSREGHWRNSASS